MKKKLILLPLFFIAVLIYSGCDEFESIPLNIPVTIEVSTSGNVASPIILNQGFCLDTDSDTYQDYQDQINQITFLEAAWRTKDGTTPNLQGSITLELRDNNNNILFTVQIPSANLDTYKTSPYILQLSQAQVQAINNFLNGLNRRCFNATATITTDAASASVVGAIDLVLEAETEL